MKHGNDPRAEEGMRPLRFRHRVLIGLCRLGYGAVLRRSAWRVLHGRLVDPAEAWRGRWGSARLDRFFANLWRRVDEMIPLAELDRLPTLGSRHNVVLAAVTTAAYQILIEDGITRARARAQVAALGWRIYARLLQAVARPIRWWVRDPTRRLERTLRALMVFPFSASGAPGYAVEVWTEGGDIFTYWTHCPPQSLVRRLIAVQGDRGELDAFHASWCRYDWPAADLLVGDRRGGHYRRRHTLSRGDSVCDMCWRACPERHGTGSGNAVSLTAGHEGHERDEGHEDAWK